jgi:polyisoprenoid-binding protein YceI
VEVSRKAETMRAEEPSSNTVQFQIQSDGLPLDYKTASAARKAKWLANVANDTLVCFHSKKVVRTPDGKLQLTGDLTLTRVDRDLQYNPGEDYRGPVYGPPMVHRVSREATFVFEVTPAGVNEQKAAAITASGSTAIAREGFPQLVRAVVSTHWPPLVMDENCQNPAGGTEDYRGFRCTGTFMEASGLPRAPIEPDFVGAGWP